MFKKAELDILCININDEAHKSMPESGFAKFIRILQNVTHGQFGAFNTDKWRFTGKASFEKTDHTYVEKTMVCIYFCKFF